MNRTVAVALAAGMAVVSMSCGGDDTRKTYPVTGTVLVDGKPADAGVLVHLHPQYVETDKFPIHPKGETDAQGAFRMTTYNTGDGAPEGEYLVTVEWPQRQGMSPHFGGDLFGGAFANVEANKGKAEFKAVVTSAGVQLNLDLKLTPEQRKAMEAAKKKAADKQSSMFNLGGK